MPVGRYPGHVRVVGMRDDARDGLRLAQPHVRERLAAVLGLVHAVAERRALPVVGLTGPDPEDVRVRGRERERAHRVRAVAVEDGLEGGPVVGRLPQPAGREAHEVGVRVVRMHGQVVDPSPLPERPDVAPRKRAQQRMVGGVDGGVGVLGRAAFGQQGHRREQREADDQ
ncbi:MAG: hypothetical protein F4020_01825 [Gammaproteobacteria bacterium]|nr:hypothetical protein [Gammaproteobacteria bacterium]